MPQWASRITLDVVKVNVERMQSTDGDATNPWVWRIEFKASERERTP